VLYPHVGWDVSC